MRRVGSDRPRMTALLALPLAVLAVSCASQQTARNGGLPVLHLGGSGGAEAAAVGAPAMGMATYAEPYGPTYVLVGTLPDQPTHAKVWRWPTDQKAGRDDVARLAAAFGINAKPQRHAHGWIASSPTGELHVRDGATEQWSYVRADLLACPPNMIDVDNSQAVGYGCATAVPSSAAPVQPGGSAPASAPSPKQPPRPDDAITKAAAHDVLAALALTGTQQVSPGYGFSELSVSPTLDSMPTGGIETTIQVDEHGIRSGMGNLATPTPGDDYPLRTAKSAFDDLANRPRPMVAQGCAIAPPSGPAVASCPPPPAVSVTGATLGLQQRFDDNEQLLVPTWFFTVEGSAWPIAVVAIDPAFLAPPANNEVDSTGGGSAGPIGTPAPAPPPSFVPVQSSPSAAPPARPTLPPNSGAAVAVSPAVSAQ